MSTMSIWSNMCSSCEVSLFIFCLDNLCVGNIGVFSSPTITVLVSICALMAIRIFFLMLMNVPVFRAYMLRIDISSWWIVPFLNIKCPSFSLLIDFSLNSVLSYMSIATPACLWGPFAWKNFVHLLTLNQYLFFSEINLL
jgi:hypothetical protein